MNAITRFAAPCIGLWLVVAVSACSSQPNTPPEATVTELEPTTRAAKDPNCYMPVINVEPVTDFRKIAIVDG
jgi:hypothetical protein